VIKMHNLKIKIMSPNFLNMITQIKFQIPDTRYQIITKISKYINIFWLFFVSVIGILHLGFRILISGLTYKTLNNELHNFQTT